MKVLVIAGVETRRRMADLGLRHSLVAVDPSVDPSQAFELLEPSLPDAALLEPTPTQVEDWSILDHLRSRSIPTLVLAHNHAVELSALRRGASEVLRPESLQPPELNRLLRLAVERQRRERAVRSETEAQMLELRERERELLLLNQMGELLQSCLEPEDAYSVILMAAKMAFLEAPSQRRLGGGSLAIGTAEGVVVPVGYWGEPAATPASKFRPDRCFGMRRGTYCLSGGTSPLCPHLRHSRMQGRHALCLPLIAQGEALGLIHLVCGPKEVDCRARLESMCGFATTFAEHVALSLANLRLQANLRQLAVRDPLTGLLNRRYMDDLLEREIKRAVRLHSSVGLLMLDIDHFKTFNDRFGHPEGDRLLASLGGFLVEHTRDADIACRYGGDEFLLILPDASVEAVSERAEQLRASFQPPPNAGDPGWTVTLSMGAAAFPAHGRTAATVLRAADAALYEAKRGGRNRVAAAPIVAVA